MTGDGPGGERHCVRAVTAGREPATHTTLGYCSGETLVHNICTRNHIAVGLFAGVSASACVCKFVNINMCACMCVCMHACVHACKCACMQACMDERMHACTFVCVNLTPNIKLQQLS